MPRTFPPLCRGFDAAPQVSNGGVLVQASCTARITMDMLESAVVTAARGTGCRFEVFDCTEHALDHPVRFPEGAYLKAVYARVYRRK